MSVNQNSLINPTYIGGKLPPALNPSTWQDVFIATYGETLSIARACKEAGVTRPTVYKYLRMDAEFKERFDHAKEDCLDSLQASVLQRARDGVTRVTPILYKGVVVATKVEQHYSDRLAEFLLTHQRPEVYNPDRNVNLNINDNRETLKLNLTTALQNALEAGMKLTEAFEYLTLRGVSPDDLKLIDDGDLTIPPEDVRDVTNVNI